LSGARFLLLYLGAGDEGPWLRLDGDRVVDRGEGFAAIPLPDDRAEVAETVVGIVPGPDVAIHWVELPDLAEAQAAAAARLMASEVSAERLDNLHVALSARRDGEDERIMGVVGADRMTAWIAEAQAAGFRPRRAGSRNPAAGAARRRAGHHRVRPAAAGAGIEAGVRAEPELVALLGNNAPLTPVTADESRSPPGRGPGQLAARPARRVVQETPALAHRLARWCAAWRCSPPPAFWSTR
jgi:general secretion pathway protein L